VSNRFLLALPVLCACLSVAQVCSTPTGAGDRTPRGGIKIPVTIHGGGVFVPVVMNNGQTYNFLLDSGFEDSVLDPATIRALDLKSGDKHTEAAPGGKVETSSVSGVKRVVGGIALVNGSLSSLDLSGFDPLFGQRLDGVLGYDFFQQFVVVLDYQHRLLTLCDPGAFQAAGEQPVPLNLQTRQPYIDVDLEGANGKSIRASIEIDTGKVDPFSLSAAFARRNGLMTNASTFLAVKGVSLGGDTQAWVTRAKPLRFANFTIKEPVMGIAEEQADRAGQLGYEALRRFTITFDYSRKRAYFESNPSFDEPYQFDHAGFILGAGGADLSTLTAFMVIADTPASAAGLREGDEILTVNSRAASTFTLDEARKYFEHAMGAQRLTIRRNGSTMTFTVQCHPIV
jgi:hypothetical protein